MVSSLLIFCIQLFIFQIVTSQCVNRIVQGPNGPIELLPNQVLLPPGVPYIPGQRQVFIPGPNPGPPPQPVVLPPAPVPAEYLPPVMTNVAPPQGNVFVSNMQQAVSNLLPGNIFVPNLPIPNVQGNVVVPPNMLPGNVIVPNIVPNMPGNIVVPNMPGGNTIVPNYVESYAPVVTYDNSVANSLANALQLLVVSSLLSTTLPQEPPCYNPYPPGYSYAY